MSPESVLKGEVYTYFDIWSLDCIMIEMLIDQLMPLEGFGFGGFDIQACSYK